MVYKTIFEYPSGYNLDFLTLDKKEINSVIERIIDFVSQGEVPCINPKLVPSIKKRSEYILQYRDPAFFEQLLIEELTWSSMDFDFYHKDDYSKEISCEPPEMLTHYLKPIAITAMVDLDLHEKFFDVKNQLAACYQEMCEGVLIGFDIHDCLKLTLAQITLKKIVQRKRYKAIRDRQKEKFIAKDNFKIPDTDDFFAEFIDFDRLSRNSSLVNFISEIDNNLYLSNLKWDKVSSLELTDEFLAKFADRLDWLFVSKALRISDEAIIKYAERIVWSKVQKYRLKDLSDELRTELQFKGYL